MERLIEENVTQPRAEQIAKTFFSQQTTLSVLGEIIFVICAAIVAVWWLNRKEQ
jgi:hypothetical protein